MFVIVFPFFLFRIIEFVDEKNPWFFCTFLTNYLNAPKQKKNGIKL